MKTNDGGQAFPGEYLETTHHGLGHTPTQKNVKGQGMTLRDYFMAHAPDMPGWYSDFMWEDKKATFEERFFSWRTYYADAMIKERSKE